jgi:hypothetical protein
MKKVIVVLTLIFAISLPGFSYVAKAKSDKGKAVAAHWMNHYPEVMPEVILWPVPGFPLY